MEKYKAITYDERDGHILTEETFDYWIEAFDYIVSEMEYDLESISCYSSDGAYDEWWNEFYNAKRELDDTDKCSFFGTNYKISIP